MSDLSPSISQLMRSDIVQMTPYTPIKPFHILSRELGIPPEQIVKLDANENPYGMSPRALSALRELHAEIPIYPDPASLDLREALAPRLGVAVEQLVLGSGADELIELLFKLFVGPGEAVINCPPTFGMYSFCAAVSGAREIIIARDAHFQLDVDAIEAAVIQHRAKLLLLCAPNNPDGGGLPPGALERLLRLNTMVVLDEAYIAFAQPDLAGEFGPQNSARLVAQHPNLVVLRTFSKWAGLAGLRCGYGVFAPQVAAYLMTIKQPYNVNVAARAAALASLEDLPLLAQRVQSLIAERERFYQHLTAFEGLEAIPGSQANFVLLRLKQASAPALKEQLARRGVLLRYFAKAGLENHLRVSIGTPAQMAQLTTLLEELL